MENDATPTRPVRDLEKRLVELAIMVVKMTEGMPSSPAGRYYGGQILRSSGSAALNYGEAQGGETHRDFTHKLKIVRKELRESYLSMQVIVGAGLHSDEQFTTRIAAEVDELLVIFTKAVKTAESQSPRR